ACLSNQKQIGLGMIMYVNDSDSFYPIAYRYREGDSSSLNGYLHWSGMIHNYCKGKVFVCPTDPNGGWGPACYGSNSDPKNYWGEVVQVPEGQESSEPQYDMQAPNISYTANELICPRKKKNLTAMPWLTQVKQSRVRKVAGTILLCEYTSEKNCLWDTSDGGGAAIKSHRPTSGVSNSGSVFNGEYEAQCNAPQALTEEEAEEARATARGGSASHHITYTAWDRHQGQQNYVFADGHAAPKTLAETLDPGNFLWGLKAYSVTAAPEVLSGGSAVK
ncbi:MAG: hypothetical protein PHV59_13085, partial [Victivallales bacterium]|nr:hypothetical protein [Victivallales bacterium]